MTGFDVAQARYDGATPADVPDLADDPGTACLGYYEQSDTEDAYERDQRSLCYLCGGVVCAEHDETETCDGSHVHTRCHRDGCGSAACAADARDDALLTRDEERRGR